MRSWISFLAGIGLVGFFIVPSPSSLAAPPSPPSPSFALLQQALQETLHLHFAAALTTAARLEPHQQPTLASRLLRGMIAYFQVHWQTSQAATASQTGHTLLQKALEEGQKPHTALTNDPADSLFRGLAAIFDALLQQQHDTWMSLQLFAKGQSLLQQTLIEHDTMTDAHLGLGLVYFAGTDLPPLLRRLWRNVQGDRVEKAIHHLHRAIEGGHFSREVAQTFLARLYELEHRYEAAIAVGQSLQEAFPDNWYYALLTGRSQCALSRYAACTATLEGLASRLQTAHALLASRSDRFDLYYYLGLGLKEAGRHAKAFAAFRQAINEDPRTLRDETLWAKYYLATLYERRGQAKTARQIYTTLLRGRNVEDLHQRVQQRLGRLQSKRLGN